MSGIPHSSGTHQSTDADLLQLNANIQELSNLVLFIASDMAALRSTQTTLISDVAALEARVTALGG